MESKIVLPYAPILVESTRSIGYSFETALADIIDNSIGKEAEEIKVHFSSKDPQYVAILDNGTGMTESELESAMRYGSKSSLDVRDKDDLGRFGLGLKTASLSQCRRLTVITKKNNELSAACWDLDFIIRNKDWSLIVYSKELCFLKMNMIPQYGIEKALDSWTGPEKTDQDFNCDNTWYEVKSTVSGASTVKISSVEQLDSAVPGHWYYERANGQYNQETYKATPKQKARFIEQHPKNQKITKTEFAKYMHVFQKRPDIASLGGQKAFIKFADEVSKKWNKNNTVFNEAGRRYPGHFLCAIIPTGISVGRRRSSQAP